MRRRLHSLLVGLLVFSLSLDAARACGHLGSWQCVTPDDYVVVVVAGDGWGCCGPVASACPVVDCGCDGMTAVPEACDLSACCGEITLGETVDGCGSPSVAVVSSLEQAGPVMSDSVLVTGPGSAPAPATPEPTVALPALEPVAPVSAAEPAAMPDALGPPESVLAEPVAAPTQEPEPVAPVVPAPAPRNRFEEADALEDAGAEPAAAPEPATDPAVEPQAVREPLRRWIDSTAAFAVVGRLVDVRGDHVEILRVDGRSVTVPLDRLSSFDQGYVSGAAERFAVARSRGPLPRDTARR